MLGPPADLDHRSAHGFSLIEVLVTLALVGLLCTVAYPSYQQHLIRTRRTEMQTFMLEVASREETFLLEHRAYADTLEALQLTLPTRLAAAYTVTLLKASETAYTLSATPHPQGPQAGDPTLAYTHDGTRVPADLWP